VEQKELPVSAGQTHSTAEQGQEPGEAQRAWEGLCAPPRMGVCQGLGSTKEQGVRTGDEHRDEDRGPPGVSSYGLLSSHDMPLLAAAALYLVAVKGALGPQNAPVFKSGQDGHLQHRHRRGGGVCSWDPIGQSIGAAKLRTFHLSALEGWGREREAAASLAGVVLDLRRYEVEVRLATPLPCWLLLPHRDQCGSLPADPEAGRRMPGCACVCICLCSFPGWPQANTGTAF